VSFYVGLDLGQAADFTVLAVLKLANSEEGERELHLRHLERYSSPFSDSFLTGFSVVRWQLRDRSLSC
jgi:hypothetical protein